MTEAPPRVLLVEDDDGDALLVRECLREVGFSEAEITWQRTLTAGLLALETPPECVLLDLGLPDADGLGALHQVVAAAGEVPVIVLTGRHGRMGDDAVAAGAQDYLVKDDITPELLDRSIRYARERKRALRAELRLRAEQSQTAERARLERGLLPTPLLHGDRLTCATYYQPGSDLAVLGGDFFDVVETHDGRVRAVIGDVMGHGPDEAALGVHLRVAWRTLVLAGAPDDWILDTLARLLQAEGGGPFVTVCDVSIELDSTVALRVAGHPAPLLCANGRTRYLDVVVGAPLGVEALSAHQGDRRWPESRTSLPPGSSLLLYTDGLLDGYRPATDDASLGVGELLEATERCLAGARDVELWLPQLVEGAPARSSDDTAVVVLTSQA